MRVLILGAKGMLGQELVRAFHGADVVGWDREEIDITDGGAVRTSLATVRPDVLINAVAWNAVDAIEGDPARADAVNGSAVGTLAEAAAALGATFVHYSTDYVFGGAPPPLTPPPDRKGGNEFGYTEDAVPSPQSAYGRSKLAGERALLTVAAKWPSPEFGHSQRWYCVRTSRLFGRPASSPEAKRSFVDTMVALAATRDRIEVVDAEVSSPTYAPDLAAATRELVCTSAYPRHPLGGSASSVFPSGMYHRTNDGSCTWYAFAREIFRITGWGGTLVPVPASALPRPAPRPAYSVLRTMKLPPLRRWEDALGEYLSAEQS